MGIMLLWEYSVRGQYSTVWLAEGSQCVYLLCCIDIPERFGRFVAVKVQTIDINHLVRSDILEAEFVLLDRIRSVKMGHVHPGKGHIGFNSMGLPVFIPALHSPS